MDIYKAPKYLVFQFLRFEDVHNFMQAKKLNTLIDFPIESFDLTDTVLNHEMPGECLFGDKSDLKVEKIECKEEKPEKCLYDLYGIVNHSGGVGFGHYTAYAKNNGKWYNYDDSSVSEVDAKDIVTKKAYCIFYEKRNTDVYNIYHTLTEKEVEYVKKKEAEKAETQKEEEKNPKKEV